MELLQNMNQATKYLKHFSQSFTYKHALYYKLYSCILIAKSWKTKKRTSSLDVRHWSKTLHYFYST